MPNGELENNNQQEVEETVEVQETQETKQESTTDDYRTRQALELLAALENPDTAPLVVKTMAERLGLIGESQQPKKERQETIKSVKAIVKEKLGDSGAFIANELGEALEEVINEYNKNFQTQLQQIEYQRAAAEFQREYNRAVEELEVTEDEAGELMKLVDEFPWNGKTSIKKYLENLVKYHRTNVNKETATKEKRAANFSQRAKNVAASANESTLKAAPKKFASPKEAVEFALSQLQK